MTPDQSIAGLVAWLKPQDPATKYDRCRATDCLWTRYGRSQGFPDFNSGTLDLPYRRYIAGIGQGRAIWADTYGEALARAEAVLAHPEKEFSFYAP